MEPKDSAATQRCIGDLALYYTHPGGNIDIDLQFAAAGTIDTYDRLLEMWRKS